MLLFLFAVESVFVFTRQICSDFCDRREKNNSSRNKLKKKKKEKALFNLNVFELKRDKMVFLFALWNFGFVCLFVCYN